MALSTQQARLTLTPTARLSRRLAQENAIAAQQAGTQAWLPPKIYSFAAWLAALRHEYFLVADDDRTPIDSQQALQLWHKLIEEEVFVGSPRVAELAQRAWRLVHEHNLQHPEQWPQLLLSEDNVRFQLWAQRFTAICKQQVLVDEWAFVAELPQYIRAGILQVPAEIHLHGFELPLTPAQQNILDAFTAAGSRLNRINIEVKAEAEASSQARLTVQQYPTADAELVGAARWARERLAQEPNQSIAIVVPDLSGRVDQVDRTLRQVFDPHSFTLRQRNPEPWHISLGKPLAEWPLAQTALNILQLNNNRFSQPQIHQLLRSPFLPGWVDELPQRYTALIELARFAPYHLTGPELVDALGPESREVDQTSELARRIQAWRELRREFQESATASQWAQRFQKELTSIGFGQGRTLNSQEYQVLQRWHDLLEEFSRLDLVNGERLSRAKALTTIRDRAAGIVFRERNTGVPIEVLGVAEALGSAFDAVWITTLDSNTWPGNLGRDPLVPGMVQASVPRATSEGCLEVARLELRGLLASAPVQQASFARGTEEIAIQVAGLLGRLDVIEIPADEPTSPAPIEVIASDDQAPPLASNEVRGGTGVLSNQSACPFRAFAQRRLGAVQTTPPRPGLNNAQRGVIVHSALEKFWEDLADSKALSAMPAEQREQRITASVEFALTQFTRSYLLTLSDSARLLEQGRVERIVLRWLDLESERDSFAVTAKEHQLPMHIGPLHLTGKIDRIDELEDGRQVLIDYKTGPASKAAWFPEARINDPQLPAYALTMEPQPNGIAFARLKPDDIGFDGLSETPTDIKGIDTLPSKRGKYKEVESWPELLNAWQEQLQTLAQEFKAGHAAVDPRDARACEICHLQALCRVNERDPFLADDAQASSDE